MVLTGTSIWTAGRCDCGEMCPRHKPDCPVRDIRVGDAGRMFHYDLPQDAVIYKAKAKNG